MAVARVANQKEGWSQFSKWSPGIFFDKHKSANHPNGRPWWCWMEAPADPTHPKGIVGELIPITQTLTIGPETIRGWSAPWVPEQKYVVRGLGMLAAGNSFTIDYVTMVSDYRQANERYYRLAASTAGAKNWQAPKMYGPVEFQLRAIVGDPPKSPKLPEAAMAGDPWILGQSAQVNEKLKVILDREQGRMAIPLDEADETEQLTAQPTPSTNSTNSASQNLLAGLSQEQLDGLLEMLDASKRAKAMRDAKAAKATSQTAA